MSHDTQISSNTLRIPLTASELDTAMDDLLGPSESQEQTTLEDPAHTPPSELSIAAFGTIRQQIVHAKETAQM